MADYSYRLKKNFSGFISLFLLLGLFVPTYAQTTTAAAPPADAKVDTVIIVNDGSESTFDAAIASAIAKDTGALVLYTKHDDVSVDLINQLKNLDPNHVYILGGTAVVSDKAEKSLEQYSEDSKDVDYQVTRVSGTTATGTAVEAINQFYGPGTLNEVTLVNYNGDGDQNYQDAIHFASELGYPVIPIPSDVAGLPADVAALLHTNGVDKVTLVGDVKQETEVKDDLADVKVKVDVEVSGTEQQVVTQLQDKVITEAVDEAKSAGDTKVNLVLVEDGQVPPATLPGDVVVFYKDENNDNLDDNSGEVLDGIGSGLYDKINLEGREEGVKVGGIEFTGDNKENLDKFKENIEKVIPTVTVELGKPDNSISTAIEFSKTNQVEISDYSQEKGQKWEDAKEEHKAEFTTALSKTIDTFKAHYTERLAAGELSEEAIKLGAQIIDEENKGDTVSEWSLMTAFGNEEYRSAYEKHKDDPEKVGIFIEDEKETVDEKVEKLVGTERAREVANSEAGKKIGLQLDLLKVVEFTPPTEVGEVGQKIVEKIPQGEKITLDNWPSIKVDFIETEKKEAQKTFTEKIASEEAQAVGSTKYWAGDPTKWKEADAQKYHEEWLSHYSEAILAGVTPYYSTPAERAQIITTFDKVDSTLAAKMQTAYLSPDEWKSAYETWSKDGKLSEGDIKAYEAAATAYRTWEQTHVGNVNSPSDGHYDSKTGQFSFVNDKGELVTSTYDGKTGTVTYNYKGELVQGTKTGTVYEYTESTKPENWKQENGVWTNTVTKETYIPPVTGNYVYNPDTGKYSGGNLEYKDTTGHEYKYEYTPQGYTWQGSTDAGWKYDDSKKAWVSPTGETTKGTTYADTGTGSYSTAQTGTWTQDPATGAWTSSTGVTWSQSSDGKWTSSTGQTYDAGAYVSGSTGGTSGTGTYSGSTSSGSYSGSYSDTGSYSGSGSYSGGSGSYSGGSGSYSGGSSGGSSGGYSGGGGSAPSGGGGGGYTGP